MRIGIFGGTFDPIHIGHLLIAERAKEEAKLDSVIFVPNGLPPHKKNVTSNAHRWAMCYQALLDHPEFSLSDIEMSGHDYFYTVNTIKELKKLYPDDDLCLIIGSDQAFDFASWNSYEEVLSLSELIIVQRALFEITDTEIATEIPGAKYTFIEATGLALSSTLIKDRIYNKKTIKFLVPSRVIDYIKERKLYNYSE